MNPFEMVVIIVLIAVGAGVINNYLKHKAESGEGQADTREWMSKLDAMEERIRVLEKIVTDRDYDLKQKFRDL